MKILIADPHTEVQAALRLILERIPAVTLLSETSSLVQLLGQCAQECPDLVLLDLNLVHPSRSRTQPLADVIRVLRRLCPRARVVIMSSEFEAEQQAQAAGADGFISKTDPPDEVLSAIARFLITD